MPGFNIGSSGPGPSITADVYRAHRWKIVNLGENSVSRYETVYAQSMTWPSVALEEESVMGAAINYKFAKAAVFEDVTVTFYDVLNLFDQLNDWQKKVYNPQDGIGLANDYKKESKFALTTENGDEAVKATLKNSWPKAITHSQLTYEASELKLVSLVLSYDWVEFE